MRTSHCRQKAYVDYHCRLLEFSVSGKVFLKVSPIKGVLCINKKNKLDPWFIGPFEILERVELVAYHLDLPSDLGRIHDVFHVSQLKKYIPDPNQVMLYQPLQNREDLTYKEKPI